MNHTRHQSLLSHLTWVGTLLLALGLPFAAQASSQLAIDKGCYSCHGPNSRGEAPNFQRLPGRLSKYKGDPDAEQKFVGKYLAGEMFGHIDAHERLSQESAKVLIHWLVESAK